MLASLVGYVGDFDLAEESTQEAFAIALRLPGTTATISGWVFSVACENPAVSCAGARDLTPCLRAVSMRPFDLPATAAASAVPNRGG